MSIILDIKNLSVEYKKGDKTIPALRNVSISLQEKEILGIVGESGCGKSTLAHSILKLIPNSEAISFAVACSAQSASTFSQSITFLGRPPLFFSSDIRVYSLLNFTVPLKRYKVRACT